MSGLVNDLSADVFRLTRKYLSRVFAPFRGAYRTALSTAKSLTVASLTALAVIAIITAISCILIVSTSLTYIALYSRIVPTSAHEFEAHFDYGSPQPTALINLTAPQYYNTNDKLSPLSNRLLYAGQTYNLILKMKLTDTSDHVAMSVITSQCEMLYNDTLQARSITSLLLPYQSFAKRLITRAIRFIPLLLGVYDDSIYISHELIEEWKEMSIPTTSIRIILTTPNAKRLRIINSSIQIIANLSGIRYFMYHYWFSSALFIGIIIFTFQFISTIIVIIGIYIWWQYSTPLTSASSATSRTSDYTNKLVVTEFDDAVTRKQNDELDHLLRDSPTDIPNLSSAISGSSASSSDSVSRDRSNSESNNLTESLFNDVSPGAIPEGIRHRHHSLGDDTVQQT